MCSEFEQTTSARQRHDVGSVVKCIRRPETELLRILIRYDTIEEFNVDSKAEYRVLQLNLAHVARNYKQSQCLFNSVQVKIHEDSPEGKE